MAIRKLEDEEIIWNDPQDDEAVLDFLYHLSKQKEYEKMKETVKEKDCKLENWKLKI